MVLGACNEQSGAVPYYVVVLLTAFGLTAACEEGESVFWFPIDGDIAHDSALSGVPPDSGTDGPSPHDALDSETDGSAPTDVATLEYGDHVVDDSVPENIDMAEDLPELRDSLDGDLGLVADALGDTNESSDIFTELDEDNLLLDGEVTEPIPEVEFLVFSVEPNPLSTLSGIVTIETSLPCRIQMEHYSGETDWHVSRLSELGTSHTITLVVMRPETTYSVFAVAYVDGEMTTTSDELEFTTGAIPDDIPPFEVVLHRPDLYQPGTTFYAPITQPSEYDSPPYIGLDMQGTVVWYYDYGDFEAAGVARFVQQLPDGNLLLTAPNTMRVITPGGETLEEVTASEVGGGNFHHEGIRLPNGRFMTLVQDNRHVFVPELDETTMVCLTGDTILELDTDGEITWEWSTFDHLEGWRFPTELSLSKLRHCYDWTHANALFWIEEDNSVLLSLRHQNWLIKIDRDTGAIDWIFGDEGYFELTNFDLEMGRDWFYSQHAPEFFLDEGLLILYDNGNDRPGDEPRSSRGVTYLLDETGEGLFATQTWQFETDYYTPFLGDANRLENGNVLLCAGGKTLVSLPAQIIELSAEMPATRVWELNTSIGTINRANRFSLEGER